MAEKAVEFTCRHCGKGFTDRGNKSRHELHRCSKRAAEKQVDIGAIVERIQERLSAELKDGLSIVSELRGDLQQLQVALPVAAGSIEPVEDYSLHAKAGRDAHQYLAPVQQNSVNVTINNFGQENTEGLEEEIGAMLDALPPNTPGMSVISKMLGLIYDNPNRPENQTVRITNRRDNVPSIMTDDGWKTKSEIELYPAMIDRACTVLQFSQDFRLGDTREGGVVLAKRSTHVRSAFDAEKASLSDPKAVVKMMRPMLYL